MSLVDHTDCESPVKNTNTDNSPPSPHEQVSAHPDRNPHGNHARTIDTTQQDLHGFGNVSDTEQQDKPEIPSSFKNDFVNGLKGLGMGICDAVPGVSGGTVALIVGIYERLFVAISHVDRRLFGYLRRGEWSLAARHLDARFLAALVFGMGLGYVIMSVAIKHLMASDSLRALTLASFTGMILGSVWLVFRMIRPGAERATTAEREEIRCIGCALAGFGIASLISFQSAHAVANVSLVYLFCCTVVAICAMILPGVSGAMMLLIFGVYYHVVEIPRELIHLENVGGNLVKLGVFFSGCLVGLLTFARLIKYFLHRWRAPTLSAMMGLMLGSLLILWPFQQRIEPTIEGHKPTYEAFLPSEFDPIMIGVSICIVFFAAAVIMTDRVARSRFQQRLNEHKLSRRVES